MKTLPFDIRKLFEGRGIGRQRMNAVRNVFKLVEKSAAEDKWSPPDPYVVYMEWHRRLLNLFMKGDIPDWVGFAAFRYITDFNIPMDSSGEPTLFPPKPSGYPPSRNRPDVISPIENHDDLWFAAYQYFNEKRDIESGKFSLQKDGEDWLLGKLGQYVETFGGQAGNILWLWDTIGANSKGYMSYFPHGLKSLISQKLFKGLSSVPFLSAKDDWKWRSLRNIDSGVRNGSAMTNAPSGGSFVASREGRRLILQIKGFRDLQWQEGMPLPWKEVAYLLDGAPLHGRLNTIKANRNDLIWPMVPLFLDASIEEIMKKDEKEGKEVPAPVLRINLASDSVIESAFKGKVDLAILGGMQALFRDDYQNAKANKSFSAELRTALVEVARRQMKALKRCGIRIGMELSGIPDAETFRLIQEWCREGVVVCLGINGEDELGEMVGASAAKEKLIDLYLDPGNIPEKFRQIARNPMNRDTGFEYVTYLRALKLAEVTGVRTMYVHTTTVDFVLRKDADPGALLQAQTADIMGKGLTLAALMRRAYGNNWPDKMVSFPLAISPKAFECFFEFSRDFGEQQKSMAAGERLFESGYWLAPSENEYSVAVVPVLWPAVDEFAKKMPVLSRHECDAGESGEFSTTGSGDMTFGAFFLLAGV